MEAKKKSNERKRKQPQVESERSKLRKNLDAAARAMRKLSDLSGKNETILSINPFGDRPVIIQVFACMPGYFEIRDLTCSTGKECK